MLDNITKQRINTARDILVGKVPDPKSQVEQITIALIYKFMDDMDMEAEELGGVRKFFTGDYEQFAWHMLFDPAVGGERRLNLYSEALLKLSLNPHLPQLFRDIFKNAYLPYRDPETLTSFLKTINEFSYDHSERLGDAFEFLLSVLGSQGDAGQFRTPRHLIDFMAAIVDPRKDETILDPACGTAGFLIASYKRIVKKNSSNYDPAKAPHAFELHGISLDELGAANGKKYAGDRLGPDERKCLAENFKGYDISPDMVRLSLINLYLHGFTDPHIYEYDTLTSEDRWNEYYDVILANPPFMSPKGGIRPHKRFTISSKRSEVLFVDYIAEHLTPSGRAAVIVPEGIIFQTGKAYKSLRKMLVDENYLVGVISLPAGVFNPYSGVKTSILWMDKTLAKKTGKLLFVKIENDGFDLGAQRRPLKTSDLPEAFRQIEAYKLALQSGEAFDAENLPNVTVVEKAKVAENGEYGLSGERYKVNEEATSKFDLVRIGDVFETSSGGTPSRNEEKYWNSGTIPWIKSGEVGQGFIYKSEDFITEEGLKNSSAKIFPKNSVLIALYGATVGEVGLLKFEASTNQAVCAIIPKEKVLPEYLYYILKFRKAYLVSLSVGGAQPNISQTIIRNLQIPLPPLSVQEEIVREIEGYQRIIDGARQVVESYQSRIELDPAWEMVELGEVCEVKSGGTPSRSKPSYWNGKIPWVGSTVCKDNYVDRAEEFITEAGLKNSAAKIFQSGTTLIALVGATIGKTGYLTFGCTTNQNIAGLFPVDESRLDKTYLFYTCQMIYPNFLRLGEGKFRMANLSFVREQKIPLPDLPTQQRIVAAIERERALVAGNKELIGIFEEKIKRRIARVWGEEG
jgi:type I restriction enzyme M protein